MSKYYEIYKGEDIGGSTLLRDIHVGNYKTLESALQIYEEVKQEARTKSKEPKHLKSRMFCYMIEVDPEDRLYGYKDGKVIDNGCNSRTIYANNYTMKPGAHPYMVNIDNGRHLNYREIYLNDLHL